MNCLRFGLRKPYCTELKLTRCQAKNIEGFVMRLAVIACLYVLFIVCASLLFQTVSSNDSKKKAPKRRNSNKWRGIDEQLLEKQLAQGDEQEELEDERERLDALNKKKKVEDVGGVIFVELLLFQPDAKRMDKLVDRWRSMTRSGGMDIEIMRMGSEKVLFNANKKWLVDETFKFIALQPEVKSFSYLGTVHDPKEYLSRLKDDEEDDEEDL
jgi:hypothetical protein